MARASQPRPVETFGFRIKFHLPPGRTFEGAHPKRRIRLGNVGGRIYLIKLPEPKRHRFGARTKHLLRGAGFESYDAALECGRRLKTALALFAAERRIGLDAGQDKATASFSQAVKHALATKHATQLRDDVHGLDVYSEQPPVRHFSVEAYGTSKHVIKGYETPVRAFYERQVALTPKQQLALDLYNVSHFDNAPKTRFLTLITVVEVLATRNERSPAVRVLLEELSGVIRDSSLSSPEKAAVRKGLENLKQESISGACRQFVRDYAFTKDVEFFANCYQARSDLVHDGFTKRPEAADPRRLDELVSRVLIAALTKKAV